jgi:hypothetical protein
MASLPEPAPLPPPEVAPPAAPDGQQAGGGPALPWPQAPGVLAVLPPLDLAALERGLQRFLEQLGPTGPRRPGDRDGPALWPWVVAGTAAATACEIARRQLRRPAGGPPAEVARRPDPPSR